MIVLPDDELTHSHYLGDEGDKVKEVVLLTGPVGGASRPSLGLFTKEMMRTGRVSYITRLKDLGSAYFFVGRIACFMFSCY